MDKSTAALGNTAMDAIENLIALCRRDHDRGHLKTKPYLTKPELQEIHNNNLI